MAYTPTSGWYKNAAGQMVNGVFPANVYQDNSVSGGGGWVEGINPNQPTTSNAGGDLSLGGTVSTAVQPESTPWTPANETTTGATTTGGATYWTDPAVSTGHFIPPGETKYPGVEQKYDQDTLDYFYMLNNPGWYAGAPTAPPTGVIGSEQALTDSLTNANAAVQQGVDNAVAVAQPYTDAGASSIQHQADLSGANGPEAQLAAFDQYNESPEVAYQREQAELAIMRNASATGGLQSSPVLQELQRQAVGLAQQDYGNYYNRLSDVSTIGASSAGNIADIHASTGQVSGDYEYGTGSQIAADRTDAGNAIAANIDDITSELAQFASAQGADLAELISGGSSDIANLLSSYGLTDAQTQQALAEILANITVGSGSQVAGLPSVGSEQTGGIVSGIAALAEGIGTGGSAAGKAEGGK